MNIEHCWLLRTTYLGKDVTYKPVGQLVCSCGYQISNRMNQVHVFFKGTLSDLVPSKVEFVGIWPTALRLLCTTVQCKRDEVLLLNLLRSKDV